MRNQVTISAKVSAELRKKMTELGIRPSEVIKRALETEVRERMQENVLAQASKASVIAKKVSKDNWTRSIRQSRNER